ncbi:hypothetical protein ABIC03_001965 [Bradyrhizobium sp. RT6a]
MSFHLRRCHKKDLSSPRLCLPLRRLQPMWHFSDRTMRPNRLLPVRRSWRRYQGMSGELTNAQQAIERLKASEDQIVRDLGRLAEQLTAAGTNGARQSGCRRAASDGPRTIGGITANASEQILRPKTPVPSPRPVAATIRKPCQPFRGRKTGSATRTAAVADRSSRAGLGINCFNASDCRGPCSPAERSADAQLARSLLIGRSSDLRCEGTVAMGPKNRIFKRRKPNLAHVTHHLVQLLDDPGS